MIAFGVAAIVMGVNGRSTVQDSLRAEQIVGSEDMTPALIKKAATEAGLSVSSLDIPTVAVAGKSIDTGGEARAFAQYLRIHALESSGGYVVRADGTLPRRERRSPRARPTRPWPSRVTTASPSRTLPATPG